MRILTLTLSLLLSFALNAQAAEKAATATVENPVKFVDVIIETNMGKIELELNAERAPISVNNFLAYIESSFYDGTVFHRIINNFMIQGGGFDKHMQRKSTLPAIKNEAKNGLKNDRGTIAMARTGVVDSATSQFFINHKNNDFLNHSGRDYGYAVFGKVTSGMDVVDAIARVQTKARDVPVNPVIIKSIKLKEIEVATEAEKSEIQKK